jgi:hypothetical protein
MQRDITEAQEIPFAAVDEKMLPELIQGQISKLKELDTNVQKALKAATHAGECAKLASEKSAEWTFFGDNKKDAIEGLQKAGMAVSEALQASAEAQTLSFELQTRFANVTKHLFALGVSNIAANRAVVRELELRLAGASEEELSELARHEITSVILQLKEQEDLLRKQEQMQEGLKSHDFKIRHLLGRADDADAQQHGLESRLDVMSPVMEKQSQDISALQQQALTHQVGLESVVSSLAQTSSHAEQVTKSLLARSNDLETKLKEQKAEQCDFANMIESITQASKLQQQTISTLQQQAIAQQAGLENVVSRLAHSRSAFNFLIALVMILAAMLSAGVYFLR